ncbi:hypothetical protein EPUS_07311 [Endocarpon pusillum Z07020]|uniref:Major facilitator superfamily (MFS) profile domain-containing protein n=1 Tax=Endocarpon pusillum (strain Z07020 / HMAS-L-300199) TaxID=1263415 RepID=U1GWG2_ENDPU|nr:uncharacterized protein EPUS_07311 [Endocarpon pusillum Z07020]ERF76431.1 hypothetical protein EPUS_07311 [Endocarpon pusillum Z07020]
MGRAIAGIGSAGIFSGSSVILMHIISLAKRPMFIGFMGAIFGISSIIGPVMGGTFTDRVSWRWCFYMKLSGSTPFGTVLFLPGITCFLLALQWGGTIYAWNNSRIIALFGLAGVLTIGFTAIQTWRQDDATVPPRIVKYRSIACGMIFTMCIGGGMVSILYSIALWFQAVKGTTAVQSGVNSIPMVLGLVAGSILASAIVTRTRYYVPWMFVSTILASTGSGLITTLTRFTGHSEWIGYQALSGLGLGTGMQ